MSLLPELYEELRVSNQELEEQNRALQGQEAGFDNHLARPVVPDELLRLLWGSRLLRRTDRWVGLQSGTLRGRQGACSS